MKLQWNYYFLKEYILVWWLTVANYALSFPPTSSFYARNGSTVNTPLPTLELNHEGLWWVLGDEFQRLSQKFVFFSFLPYVGMGKHLYNLYVHSTLLGVTLLALFQRVALVGEGKKTVGFLKLFSYIFTPTLGLIPLMYRQSRAVGGRGQPWLVLAALARCASKGSRACDA